MTTSQLPGVDHALSKMRKGHEWLIGTHRRVLEMSSAGIGSVLEAKLLDAIDRFDAYDLTLRIVVDFQGCILGPGERCPEDSPVSCRGCQRE